MNPSPAYTVAADACPTTSTKGHPRSPWRRQRHKSSSSADDSPFTKGLDYYSQSSRSPIKPPKSPWRRRLRSASPARQLPDFLECLPLDKESPQSKERRPSLGKNICSAFTRSNSFTKLLSSSWAHNSASTETTWNSSFASQLHHSNGSLDYRKVEEDDISVITSPPQGLLQQVEEAIQVQTNHKEDTEESIVATHELAWARHDAGNEMGAIISMRRAHRYLTRLQHVETALAELSDLRAGLVDDLATTSWLFNRTDVCGRRHTFELILSKLQNADFIVTAVPSKKELLDQLYDIMNVGEI